MAPPTPEPATTDAVPLKPQGRFEAWLERQVERHPLVVMVASLSFFLGLIPSVRTWVFGGVVQVLIALGIRGPGPASVMEFFADRRGSALLTGIILVPLSIPAAFAAGWMIRFAWRWKGPLFYSGIAIWVVARLVEHPRETLRNSLWGVAGVVIVWLVERHFANQQAILAELRQARGLPPDDD